MIYRHHKGLLWASVSIPTVLLPWAWLPGLVALAIWSGVMWWAR